MLTENKRETILIVDDEELNRAILANLFDDGRSDDDPV